MTDSTAHEDSRRLRRLLLVVRILAVGVLAASVVAVVSTEPPQWYLLACVGVILFACRMRGFRIRWGHNAESFDWTETGLALAAVLLPLPWAVLAVATGAAGAAWSWKVPRRKTMFNLGLIVVASAAALSLAQLLGFDGGTSLTVTDVIALAVGLLSYTLLTGYAVSLVVALSQGERLLAVWRRGVSVRLAVSGGCSCVGLGVGVMAQGRLSALLVLPPLLGLVFTANLAYLRAREESDRWRELERASKALNRLDENAVVAEAMRTVSELLHPDWVELHTVDDRGAQVRYVFESEHGVQTVHRESTDAPRRSDGQSYMVSLSNADGALGELHLGFGGSVRLSARERQVLSTFSRTVSTALVHARLHQQVLREAARHEYDASHDDLTGLVNRAFFLRAAAASVDASARAGSVTGMLLIDLDHFKEVNDTLGHAAGDRLLTEVAHRLVAAVRGDGTVARLGGDEFAVLLPGLPDESMGDTVAERLLEVVCASVAYHDVQLSVEASIGVATYPSSGNSVDELLRRADVAMYEAKQSRGAVRHYRSDRDSSSLDRLTLAAELRTAIEQKQLIMHFQPQVELSTGRVAALEVLTRWQHPTRGILMPAEFVGVAEHTGLARAFTLHVVDCALERATAWLHRDPSVSLAVNLSARNLVDQGLPDDMERLLAKHGVSSRQLTLEITETAVVGDIDLAESVLGRLRRMGIELSMDDFGTGYSSLALLQRIAINELKIDRTFVSGMDLSRSDLAIVRATVELAHSLGVRVVAEGVETPAVYGMLLELGCDRAQGYLLGRPAELADLASGPGAPTTVPSPRRPYLTVVSAGR